MDCPVRVGLFILHGHLRVGVAVRGVPGQQRQRVRHQRQHHTQGLYRPFGAARNVHNQRSSQRSRPGPAQRGKFGGLAPLGPHQFAEPIEYPLTDHPRGLRRNIACGDPRATGGDHQRYFGCCVPDGGRNGWDVVRYRYGDTDRKSGLLERPGGQWPGHIFAAARMAGVTDGDNGGVHWPDSTFRSAESWHPGMTDQ